ncbi:hypothetical protein [Salarchaeum sp. JOR-1]|uniref:hypothetical protein n=1 Tax=Salarchaeum sp. JOR-1 TaxID=2599399 RepID=UPI001198B024|nr:hypothetical protein [Salarchaeum sp. JOR-1]QDX41653.1 hypothetical protein FQU85_12335 [Salarchaeum sp. JOR-1]
MRVRDWKDIVEDVVDSGADPDGWRAVAGDRSGGVGEDLYLGHPSAGVYQLKTYAKNPYEVKGAGARVARRIDDELDSFFPEKTGGGFAVQSPPEDTEDAEEKAQRLEEVVKAHADAPTTSDALFEDVMDAIDSPAFGPMEYDQYGRPDELDGLADTFEEAEELLTAELDDLVESDDVGRGFQ